MRADLAGFNPDLTPCLLLVEKDPDKRKTVVNNLDMT